jgi:hypothetical protein
MPKGHIADVKHVNTMSPCKKTPKKTLTLTKQTKTMHLPITPPLPSLCGSPKQKPWRSHATPLPYLFLQYSQNLIARECGFFSHKRPQLMTHVCVTLCFFMHYNVWRPHATPLPYLFLQYSQSLIARECGFSHTQKATNSWHMCALHFVFSCITLYNTCCLLRCILH